MATTPPRVLYCYQLLERNSHELMTDRVQYIFLELTNARHALEPDATVLGKVCYALHNMETLSGRPEGFEGEFFRLLFESAEIAIFTPQEKIKYEYDMRTERDLLNQIAFAKKTGMEEGIEKGIEKGAREERQRILEELRRQGVSESIIAKAIPQPEGH